MRPADVIEREPAEARIQTSLAEKDEQIGKLQAALSRSEMRLGDSLGQPGTKGSSDDRVLQYLCDHPEGADFDTLEGATGVSGRDIVQTLARLLDAGKTRREFPLFFAVEHARTG